MSRKSFFKSSAIAALAMAIAATAIPSTVSAAPQDGRGDRGGRDGGESRSNWGEARARSSGQAEARPQQQAQPQPREWSQPRQQSQPQQARPERASPPQWQGRGNADNAPRWGAQDRADGQRPGRDWQGGGAVVRPAPADRGGTPAIPQRGYRGDEGRRDQAGRDQPRGNDDRRTMWGSRSSTYSDRDRDQDRDRNRDRNTWNRDRNDGRRGNWQNDRRGDARDNQWRGDRDRNHQWNDRNRYDGRRWNNDWRRDRRYDWYSYRNTHRHIYRSGRYAAPYRGYYYSRLSIGFFLDSLFYSNRYWISDPWQYRLPDVYGPYRWVRYYDDVLLVDIYSGEVVDVIYDFFW